MTNPTGAIRQRDGMTFAVVTRMPAGIVTPADLEKVAKVARTYRVPMLKVTSGQRIALVGLQPGDVQKVMDELGPLAKPETAPCVKFVQACIGTEMCRYGNQDAIGMARAVDERFKDKTFPAKIKIGVSGCPRCCGESHTRDIGIMGTNKGWTVLFGGNAGTRPRFADIIARDLSAADALDCAVRVSEYYRAHAKAHERTARFMERVGMETLKSELLTLLPYIQIEKVN
ncbi:MAG: ferredoxin-nitrite reductase [Methanoregula sp. PtaU1.Bin051]|nr:MAG: ferredoxin-nitrite reductase [Methanoregula sp. PtaU1.Bin051]